MSTEEGLLTLSGEEGCCKDGLPFCILNSLTCSHCAKKLVVIKQYGNEIDAGNIEKKASQGTQPTKVTNRNIARKGFLNETRRRSKFFF